MIFSLFASLLLASSSLSLSDANRWKTIVFPDVPGNEVTFAPGKLQIEVNRSASPLLHFFEKPGLIQKARVSGTVTGNLNVTGAKADLSYPDALLRFGLIESGDRRMNALQKLRAPQWIEDLETAVLERGEGIECIHCFHLMPERFAIGPAKPNPATDLFLEKIHATPDAEGNFDLVIALENPLPVVGLWLLADGDDTDSQFTVTLTKIEIE